MEAAKRGYTQILWLFGKEHYITEVGTMNMFVFLQNEKGEKELVTPCVNFLEFLVRCLTGPSIVRSMMAPFCPV